MSQTTTTPTIERYMRLRALADDPRQSANANERATARKTAERMEAKYPDLTNLYRRAQLRAEELRKRNTERMTAGQRAASGPAPTWIQERRAPTIDELIGLYATFVQPGGPDPATNILDRLVRTAGGWVFQRLTDIAESDIENDVSLLLDNELASIRRDFMPTIKDRMDEEISLEITDLEDAESGEALIGLTLELPVDLWEQIKASKTGPGRLIRWIDTAINEDGDDEEDPA